MLDTNTVTREITLLDVNDEPAGADLAIDIDEDQIYTLTAADFGFSDPVDDDQLLSVRIASLPQAGMLTIDGNPVSIGGHIHIDQINAGDLR